MGFQESAFSLRARLHMGRLSPAVLVGVVVCACVVVACVFSGVAGAFSAPQFEIHDSTSEKAASEAGQSPEVDQASEAQETICVYVSGCVASPQVCYLPVGSRVADAVEAAGGFADDAALDAINLARLLNDGEQIVVPSAEQAAASPSGEATTPADSSSLVNINTADVSQLQTLDGIGEATARKIVADREANGPFQTIEDLKRVSGIGDKKFEGLKDSICVG